MRERISPDKVIHQKCQQFARLSDMYDGYNGDYAKAIRSSNELPNMQAQTVLKDGTVFSVRLNNDLLDLMSRMIHALRTDIEAISKGKRL